MIPQSPKTGNDQQLSGAALQFGVFPAPTRRMRNKRRIESSLQGGIDLLLRAAADQPRVGFDHMMLIDQILVNADVFIRHDLDGIKKTLQPGALHLCGFFGLFAFGEENHAMAAREIGQRFRYPIEYAWRRVLELGDHRSYFLQSASLGQPAGKLHVTLLQRAREAAHAVAMLLNVVTLGLVQDVPRVGPGISEGLHQREKSLQGVFKENIALPERVVRVDEQS